MVVGGVASAALLSPRVTVTKWTVVVSKVSRHPVVKTLTVLPGGVARHCGSTQLVNATVSGTITGRGQATVREVWTSTGGSLNTAGLGAANSTPEQIGSPAVGPQPVRSLDAWSLSSYKGLPSGRLSFKLVEGTWATVSSFITIQTQPGC